LASCGASCDASYDDAFCEPIVNIILFPLYHSEIKNKKMMRKIVKMIVKTYLLLSLDEVFFFKVSFLSLLVIDQVSDVTLDHSFDLTISKCFGSFVQK